MKWQDVSPYFKPHEILSPDCSGDWGLADIEMLECANRTREILGEPCFINHQGLWLRGVVSAREAIARGGANLTRHVQGKACDMSCYVLGVDAVYDAMKKAGFRFVLKYGSFCHGDVRRDLI